MTRLVALSYVLLLLPLFARNMHAYMEVLPTPELLGNLTFSFLFPHSLTYQSNFPNLNANWATILKLTMHVVLEEVMTSSSHL